MSGHDEGHGHVVPVKIYVVVWLALMVLLLLTVAASYWDTGHVWINNTIMLTIAVSKTLLILLYFMHVRWSSKLTIIFAASGFAWLLFLFAFSMGDYVSRPEVTRLHEAIEIPETSPYYRGN